MDSNKHVCAGVKQIYICANVKFILQRTKRHLSVFKRLLTHVAYEQSAHKLARQQTLLEFCFGAFSGVAEFRCIVRAMKSRQCNHK